MPFRLDAKRFCLLVAAAAPLLTIPCALAASRTGATPATALQQPPRAGSPRPSKSYIPYTEGQPLFQLLRAELLPADLRELGESARRSRWPQWVGRHDLEIRARVLRGDEDTVANLLFFGTRFTSQRRLLYAEIPTLSDNQEGNDVVRRRIDDMIRAIAQRPTDERIRFVHDVVTSTGIDPGTAGGRDRARDYLRTLTERAISDSRRYDDAAASAKRLEDAAASNIGYATLYHDRGLSSDASFLPDYALGETLSALKQQVLTSGAVHRVAIVGPGLDFADKREGYDFFPPQTFQPFAALDTIFRLGLASATSLRMTILDVNPRVLRHLDTARSRARMGDGYVVRLPRNQNESWTTPLVEYWERFGSTIGTSGRSEPVPDADNVLVRSVQVRPDVVQSITPRDLNIVLERLDLTPGERFDVIIATNILIYYGVFEQSLALKNLARMLRPGGLLLSNNFVVPNESMVVGGYIDVPYGPSEGDRIFWYQRQ